MLAFRKWILVVMALAIVATCAQSRPDDKDTKKGKHQAKLIAEEGAIEVMLLRHKAVQDELKLTDDQTKKIKEFAAKQWKRAQGVHELEEGKQEETWKEMTKENQKFLTDTLTKPQITRINQIGMQKVGLVWITRADVAKALNLTADQKKKLHEAQKTAHKEMHDAIHTGKDEGRKEKIEALHKAHGKVLFGVLTDDQKATWKKLRGEPFKADLSKD